MRTEPPPEFFYSPPSVWSGSRFADSTEPRGEDVFDRASREEAQRELRLAVIAAKGPEGLGEFGEPWTLAGGRQPELVSDPGYDRERLKFRRELLARANPPGDDEPAPDAPAPVQPPSLWARIRKAWTIHG